MAQGGDVVKITSYAPHVHSCCLMSGNGEQPVCQSADQPRSVATHRGLAGNSDRRVCPGKLPPTGSGIEVPDL